MADGKSYSPCSQMNSPPTGRPCVKGLRDRGRRRHRDPGPRFRRQAQAGQGGRPKHRQGRRGRGRPRSPGPGGPWGRRPGRRGGWGTPPELGLTDADKARLTVELNAGKAAVGVLAGFRDRACGLRSTGPARRQIRGARAERRGSRGRGRGRVGSLIDEGSVGATRHEARRRNALDSGSRRARLLSTSLTRTSGERGRRQRAAAVPRHGHCCDRLPTRCVASILVL